MKKVYVTCLWLSFCVVVTLMLKSSLSVSAPQPLQQIKQDDLQTYVLNIVTPQGREEYRQAVAYEPPSMLAITEADGVGKTQKGAKTKAFFNKMLDKIVITAQEIENAVKNVAINSFKLFTAPYKEKIKKEQSPIYANPYKDTVATVRKGGPVSDGEAEYLKARRLIVRRGLERFLEIKIPDNVPTPDIMISLSGGGSRAMILAWTFMRALEMIGLLDCATYMATLSGSSWFVWPWLASGLSLEAYKQRLLSIAERGPVTLRNPNEDVKSIMKLLLRMGVYDRPVTVINFYASALAAGLFYGLGENNDPLQAYMDMTKKALEGARLPYPIMTMISTPDARWFTVTPHEVHSPNLGYGVPEWSFGWKFNKGQSGKAPNPPRRDLPSSIAASSAAIALSGKDIYYNIFQYMKDGWEKDILKSLLQETAAGQLRFTSAKEYNPFKGIEGLPLYDTMRGQTWGQTEYAYFTDAGVIWITPTIALMVRKQEKVPVIYLVEDGGAVVGPDEMIKARAYAQGDGSDGKKYSFPAVEHPEEFGKSSLSFLADDDSLVMYFPRVIDDEILKKHKEDSELAESIKRLNFNMGERLKTVYATFNLKYSRAATEDLIALGQVNVLANRDKIKAVMRQYVQMYIDKVQGNEDVYKQSRTAFYQMITPVKPAEKRTAEEKKGAAGESTQEKGTVTEQSSELTWPELSQEKDQRAQASGAEDAE